jgi:hypothetical protein
MEVTWGGGAGLPVHPDSQIINNNLQDPLIHNNIITQRKLALTGEKHFLRYKIIGTPKNFLKWPRPLFRPKTIHICQMSDPSRDIVPWGNEGLSNGTIFMQF